MSKVAISKRLVAINTLSSVATRLLSLTVLVWLNQYLIKRLGAEEYSLYPVIVAISLFVQVFTAVVTGGIARYATEAFAQGNLRRVTEIVSSMAPVMAIGTGCFVVLGGLASYRVDAILDIAPDHLFEAQLMLGLLLLNQALRLLLMPFSVGLHVHQKFVWINLIQLGQELLRIAILFVLLFGLGPSVLYVVIATAASALVATVLTFVLSRRLVPELRYERGARRPELVKELTSFGGWTMVGQLAWRIRMSSDVIVLNRLGTALDVASFHIGTMVDRQVDGFMAIAGTTLNAPLTAMHATNRRESLQRAYLRGNRLSLWLALAIAAPLVVYREELVILYVGQEYISAAFVAGLIYGLYPMAYSAELLYNIAVATARIKSFMIATIVSSILKVVLAVIFVGPLQLGAFGAALSTAIVVMVTHVAYYWPMGVKMLKITFGRYLRESILPGCLPAGIAVLAFMALGALLPPTTWLAMGCDVAVGSLVYLVVAYRCFSDEDRGDFAQVLAKIKGAVRPASGAEPE